MKEIDIILTPILKSKTTYNSTMIVLGRGLKQELRLFLKERKIAIDVDINPLDEHTQPERVIYSLDSSDETILYRKISSSNPLEGKRVLCRNVKSFHLFYRDDNNNVLTYPPPVNLIRVVEINLVLEKEGREISLTSSAQLRNIGE